LFKIVFLLKKFSDFRTRIMILLKQSSLIFILTIVYSCDAIDFTRFYTIRGVLQPLPPLPSDKAVKCLNTIANNLVKCRNQSLKIWNITDYSALGDVCCAQWDAIECDLDYVDKSDCKQEQLEDVRDYFDDLTDFYNEKTCHPFNRGNTHCVIPILTEVTNERPPPPPPLAIDCLANIRPEVRLQCWKTAMIKWNVTHRHKTPVRNVCCAAWDDIDCLDQVVQIRCPQQEITVTEQFFQQIEDWAGSKACKQATYHSANCTNQKFVFDHDDNDDDHAQDNIAEFWDNYDRVVFPPKPAPRIQVEDPSQLDPNYRVESDYREFLMNYILTVFPHLMNLLILLSVILVTVIVIQCVLIGRQIKRNHYLSDFVPLAQGYQKVDV
jgi:hypothetical protein